MRLREIWNGLCELDGKLPSIKKISEFSEFELSKYYPYYEKYLKLREDLICHPSIGIHVEENLGIENISSYVYYGVISPEIVEVRNDVILFGLIYKYCHIRFAGKLVEAIIVRYRNGASIYVEDWDVDYLDYLGRVLGAINRVFKEIKRHELDKRNVHAKVKLSDFFKVREVG